MAFFLEAESGNLMIKYIEIKSYFQVGISKGLGSSTKHWCSTLTFYFRDLFIYSTISLHITRPKVFP